VTSPAAVTNTAAGSGLAMAPSDSRRPFKVRKAAELGVLIGPSFVLFVFFVFVPLIAATYYSLFKWNGFTPLNKFVGIDNYVRILNDPVFLHGIFDNVFVATLSIVIQLPLSLSIALLLNGRIRGRTFLRLLIFTPYVLSEAVTAVIWLLFLQPDGAFDGILRAIGLGGIVQLWLADPKIVMWTIFGVATWKYIGFGVVLLLAGLQGTPQEIREAAEIDGANPWQVTRFVTIPLLAPTIRILIFLSVVGSLQLFELPWIMTLGGPTGASTTMATYLIDRGFQRTQFGYGCAVAILLFIICFAFALIYQRYALRRDIEGAQTNAVGG
jgi:raffinose/stachyose/melibiose transport system permease protein